MFEKIDIPQNLKDFFAAVCSSSRISPSYIFFGPARELIFSAACEFAKILNCKSKNGCGVCSSCRLMKTLSHPDLMVISSDKSIGIDSIGELIRFMSLTKTLGAYKVGIIKRGELLTEEAASRLLKILEEPPENSVIITITTNLYRVLPTIRSRSEILRFPPGQENLNFDEESVREIAALREKKSWRLFFEKVEKLGEMPREDISNLMKAILEKEAEIFRHSPSESFCLELKHLIDDLEMIKRQMSAKIVLRRAFFDGIGSCLQNDCGS